MFAITLFLLFIVIAVFSHYNRLHISDVYKLASADLDCSTLTLPVVITQENLHEYVGTRVYDADRLYEGIAPVGVTTGLAWTPMGGSILHVEAIEKPGSANSDGGPGFEYTGKLGDVMRESAEIAYSYCRKLLFEIDPGNKLLTGSKIHLHVPEGATPKDGSYFLGIVHCIVSSC